MVRLTALKLKLTLTNEKMLDGSVRELGSRSSWAPTDNEHKSVKTGPSRLLKEKEQGVLQLPLAVQNLRHGRIIAQ